MYHYMRDIYLYTWNQDNDSTQIFIFLSESIRLTFSTNSIIKPG